VRLPGHDDVEIAPEKLRDYLLSPSHPVGRFKARLLAALGFTRERPELLEAELRRIAAAGEVAQQEDTPYGRKYTVQGVLAGPTGSRSVITVWFQERDRGRVRLVTVRPVE
jgi:hypothetical protein